MTITLSPGTGGEADTALPGRVLILACGALAKELSLLARINRLEHVTIEYLPGSLHNRPEQIPMAIEARLDESAGRYETVLLGYADCGTGGRIDEICRRRNIGRLPGPHCYAFYAGQDNFHSMHNEELGTLYLTDYLARHFDRLIWSVLGLDRHPELRDAYFGNYTRAVHLAQVDDPTIRSRAEAAALRLGLAFEYRFTGLGVLGSVLVELRSRPR